jgi:hypothetical protein
MAGQTENDPPRTPPPASPKDHPPCGEQGGHIPGTPTQTKALDALTRLWDRYTANNTPQGGPPSAGDFLTFLERHYDFVREYLPKAFPAQETKYKQDGVRRISAMGVSVIGQAGALEAVVGGASGQGVEEGAQGG